MKSKKIVASLAIVLAMARSVSGQDLTPSQSDTVKLKDVVVSSLRLERKIVQTPINLSIVNSRDYIRHSSFTAADVMKLEPGVSIGGDGVWATNVNIRGLGENRLVTLVDGNRIETATDLTASLSMVDVNDIERVEIIKGAQSSLYGSGAMGGIVNIVTKDGWFSDKEYFHGNAVAGYSSANDLFNGYLSLNAGAQRWYVKVNGSFNKANDIATPKGTLPNSSFTMNNLGARLGFKPAPNQVVKIQFQRNWSNDVGIPGGAAFAQTATAKYKDIGRTLLHGSYEISDVTNMFKALKLSVFYQDIVRDVEMNPNSATVVTQPNGMIQITEPNLVTPNGRHTTYGTQLQGTWEFSENNTLVAGIDAWRRDISSDRTKYITMTVVKPNGDTVVNHVERGESPLPDASFTSAGIFAQDEMRFFDNRFLVTLGGRLDGIFIKNEECHDVDYIIKNGEYQPLSTQRVTFEKGESGDLSWSGNLGLLYKVGQKTDLVMNVARSFRSPSLEERFKYIDLGSKVQLGDPDLKPEKGYSADLGIRRWGDNLSLQASAFVNRLTDMIVEKEGVFVYRLTEDSSIDTLPALVNSNVSKALLYGFDMSVNYNIVNGLQAYFTGTYIVGRDTENDTYLPSIPPLNGRLGVSYTYPRIGSVNLSLTAVGEKKEDKIAEGEKSTDAYCRLDLSLNTKTFCFGRCGLQLFGGIDNITDTAYTNFLSTNRSNVNYEPGRNFYVKARLSF